MYKTMSRYGQREKKKISQKFLVLGLLTAVYYWLLVKSPWTTDGKLVQATQPTAPDPRCSQDDEQRRETQRFSTMNFDNNLGVLIFSRDRACISAFPWIPFPSLIYLGPKGIWAITVVSHQNQRHEESQTQAQERIKGFTEREFQSDRKQGESVTPSQRADRNARRP
jgi:hypothetical protein